MRRPARGAMLGPGFATRNPYAGFRHVIRTAYYGPDLKTCRFKIVQKGTFAVTRATGRYRGLRDSGNFRTTLRGRLNQTGPNRCGSKIVARPTVTYEIGGAR